MPLRTRCCRGYAGDLVFDALLYRISIIATRTEVKFLFFEIVGLLVFWTDKCFGFWSRFYGRDGYGREINRY